MKILSLFDGISCGRAAFERTNIAVEDYAAFEIDKYAIKISEKNYSSIQRFGDVFEGDFTQFKRYDLLMGCSPCTYWSIAKRGRKTRSAARAGAFYGICSGASRKRSAVVSVRK